MSHPSARLGTIAFWLTWPGLWVYLRWSNRTRALVVHNDEVLLVKSWLGDGRWGLPGGGLHYGEPAIDGVRRELHEETGLALPPEQFRWLAKKTSYFHGLRIRYDLYAVEMAERPATTRQRGEITDLGWLKWRDIEPASLSDEARDAITVWFSREGFATIKE